MSLLPQISAVSYLNTCPLVWGLQHGGQSGLFALRFELPSICAESVRSGTAIIGLVPVIEAFRQNLETVSDVCIGSDGPVRSIFLLHRKPLRQIQSVALDTSSRTSVALTRILLAERYGVITHEQEASPDVDSMLANADAAVLIGDPALQLDPASVSFGVLDLGAEWQQWTGLPMVYAVWAGKALNVPDYAAQAFRSSFEFGKANLEQIVAQESIARNLAPELAQAYLTRHIRYELDYRAREGMKTFERLARQHGLVDTAN